MTAITLLDGGMGQELVHRTGDNPTPLWSTHVMAEHPGLVQEIHADFFAAGATIATTNTYAIHRDRLEGTESAANFTELHLTALGEAVAARKAHGSGRIAGSIGPLIASYRPDIHPDAATAIPLYAEVARTIAHACDFLIGETVVSIDHAQSLIAGAKTTELPLWIALSTDETDGTKLRSGEALADVIPHLNGAEAILINCTAPEVIPAAMNVLSHQNKPFGGYANGFTKISDGFLGAKPTVDALTLRHDFTPEAYAEHVMGWVDQGATIVGGCCEVSPTHIAAIANRLRAANHQIV